MHSLIVNKTQYLAALADIPKFRDVFRDATIDIKLMPNSEIKIISKDASLLDCIGNQIKSMSMR